MRNYIQEAAKLGCGMWGKNFKSNIRYLYGKPAHSEQCLSILKKGTQRIRYIAAIHLALAKPEQVLFEVCGMGRWQHGMLSEN